LFGLCVVMCNTYTTSQQSYVHTTIVDSMLEKSVDCHRERVPAEAEWLVLGAVKVERQRQTRRWIHART